MLFWVFGLLLTSLLVYNKQTLTMIEISEFIINMSTNYYSFLGENLVSFLQEIR